MRYTKGQQHVILKSLNKNGVKQDVNFICDLDPEIYGRIVPSIQTLHVIVKDKQLEHIKERHPDISETVMERLAEVILSPD